MTQKEELRRKFDKFMNSAEKLTPSRSRIFDFFYAEIEKLQASEDELCLKVQKEQDEAVRIYNEGEERDKMRLDKISHLHSTLEAAETLWTLEQQEVVYNLPSTEDVLPEMKREALEKYQQLKTKSQS